MKQKIRNQEVKSKVKSEDQVLEFKLGDKVWEKVIDK